jgi:hypothetical protein
VYEFEGPIGRRKIWGLLGGTRTRQKDVGQRLERGSLPDRAKSIRPAGRLFCRIAPLSLTIILASAYAFPAASRDKSDSGAEGFAIELPYAEADVTAVVQSVAADHVIRGTYIYEREKTLNDATTETSSSYFGSSKDGGHVFYKVRKDALAPRNFKNSADIGIITVRYIVRPVSPVRTRLEITAVFVEDGSRRLHTSNGTVETSEFSEIQNQLTTMQRDRMKVEDAREKREAAAAEVSAAARERSEETRRYQTAESSLKGLQQRADELQHALEVRAINQNTELKAAPFRSAATLTRIPAGSDVLVEIITTYWYGVEMRDGHRGWLRRDQVASLP